MLPEISILFRKRVNKSNAISIINQVINIPSLQLYTESLSYDIVGPITLTFCNKCRGVCYVQVQIFVDKIDYLRFSFGISISRAHPVHKDPKEITGLKVSRYELIVQVELCNAMINALQCMVNDIISIEFMYLHIREVNLVTLTS